MPDNSSSNTRIAKNTIMLYFRMFLTMGIGLFTSRVVLRTLGASDYGIYNLVGGFVSMLAYLNAVFIGSTQRFLSFSLGKGDKDELNKVFSTVVLIHYCLAFLILIVAESFGVWFVNNALNIDPERLAAANWVFQCSLISLFITIISVPYNASIISHEHMHVYAYVSVIDALLKMGIVFLLVLSPYDYLITYAVLHVFISLIIRSIYTIYCKRHFEECRFKRLFDRSKFKEIASYSGWIFIGNLGFTFKDQFSNIILNQFFGTVINAARGIAGQVNGMINSFAHNFFMAIAPQITKQYAAENYDESRKLVYIASKFTFYLLLLISIPAIINMPYLLKLWLVDVPDYTSEFVVITIIATLVGSLSNSVTTALQATGDIKVFQIGISIIMLAELPIAYILLSLGYEAPYALLPAIITNLIGVVFRFMLLKNKVDGYYSKEYFILVVLRCILTGSVCLAICLFICNGFTPSVTSLILTSLISVMITVIVILVIGITNYERRQIVVIVKKKILKKE